MYIYSCFMSEMIVYKYTLKLVFCMLDCNKKGKNKLYVCMASIRQFPFEHELVNIHFTLSNCFTELVRNSLKVCSLKDIFSQRLHQLMFVRMHTKLQDGYKCS